MTECATMLCAVLANNKNRTWHIENIWLAHAHAAYSISAPLSAQHNMNDMTVRQLAVFILHLKAGSYMTQDDVTLILKKL